MNSLLRSDTNTKKLQLKGLARVPRGDSICSSCAWHHCACNTHCHSKAAINGVWRLPYEAEFNADLGVPSSESLYIKPTRSVNTQTNTSPWSSTFFPVLLLTEACLLLMWTSYINCISVRNVLLRSCCGFGSMFNLAALGAITFFYTGDRQTDVWIPLFLLSEEMSLFSCGV